MDKHITVFVVADDAHFRDSVIGLVRSKGLRAEAFSSGGAFLAQHDPTRKSVVIVDVRARDGGWDLLRELKGNKAFVPVIAVASDADIPLAVQTMREGAVGFLEKPASDEDLWRAITDALKIEQHQHPQRKELAELKSRLTTLTEDELDVFRRLFSGHANKRIANDLDLGLRTVELRRANIIKKMQAESISDLIRIAILLDIVKFEE